MFSYTGFYFTVQGMANVSSFDICFEEQVYFYELFTIQVQYLQLKIVFHQVLPPLSVSWWYISLQSSSGNL